MLRGLDEDRFRFAVQAITLFLIYSFALIGVLYFMPDIFETAFLLVLVSFIWSLLTVYFLYKQG